MGAPSFRYPSHRDPIALLPGHNRQRVDPSLIARRPNERPEASGGYPYYILIAFLILVALCGGASRADALSQLFVRLGSIGIMAALLLSPFPARTGPYRPALWFAGGLAALILVQLIPLPPEAWRVLPGREFYARLAGAAGIDQPWRPLNLAPDMGWNSLLALLPPLAALVCLLYQPRLQRSRLISALLVLIALSALLGIGQMAAGPNSALRYYAITSSDAPVGLLANRNHHALLLAIGLPMLAIWANGANQDRHDQTHNLAAIAATALFLLMILVIGSRAGLAWGVLGLSSAVLLWKPTGSQRDRRYRVWIIGGLAIGVAALIAAVMTFDRAESIRRLVAVDLTDDLRAKLAEPLIDMVRTFMPAGSGFGSFDAVFRRFEPFETLTVQYVNHAHNDLAQIAIEGGVAALLALAMFLLWWMLCSWRLWTGRVRVDGERARGRLGSVATLIVMLASLVDYPLRTPLIAVVFAFACGWMLAACSKDRLAEADASA